MIRPHPLVVVIVGAGASRPLGKGSPLPLMQDWATSLRKVIDEVEPGAADVIGLEADLRGDLFEARLGQFLAFQRDLDLVGHLARLGAEDARHDHPYIADWLSRARRRSASMVELIRGNLFDNFGYPRFDDELARSAYAKLQAWLTEGDENVSLAFATTNYDATIETAYSALGFTILDGFEAPGPYATPVLNPLGLAQQARRGNDLLPVLHLHGAVGWYRASDGPIRRHASDLPYNSSLGTPALLLPDATKSVDSLAGAETLWDEFRLLLADASHVLVLGHSLHDRHLVELLANRSRLAACWYAPRERLNDPDVYAAGKKYVSKYLPTAAVIPCEFGPQPAANGELLHKWLHQ